MQSASSDLFYQRQLQRRSHASGSVGTSLIELKEEKLEHFKQIKVEEASGELQHSLSHSDRNQDMARCGQGMGVSLSN